jgi:lysophospholipase L1-like esterase
MDPVTLGMAKSAARREYAPHGLTAAAPYRGLIPVCDHVGAPDQSGALSNGTNITGVYQLQHKVIVRDRIPYIIAQFANYYCVGFSGETVGLNNITVKAGFSIGDGVWIPATFNSGVTSVTLAPGQTAWTDPVPISHKGSDATNPYILSRTVVTVASGEKWPYTNLVSGAAGAGNSARPGMEGGAESTSAFGTDYTSTGTITGSNANCYSPLQILGSTPSRVPVIGIIGDSIASGANDNDYTQGGFSRRGFISRRLEAEKIPFVRVSNAGDRVTNWLQRTKSAHRRRMLPGVDHVICEYGINDLYGGGVASDTVKTLLVQAWTEMADAGPKVWQTTYPPVATSTDNFATTTNQTTNVVNTRRIEVNDWVRAGAPIHATTKTPVAIGTSGALLAGQTGHPLSGYHEIADVVESARNSGIWKANGTANAYVDTDGLHPKSLSHIAMAAALNLTQMGYAPTAGA